MQCHEDDLDYGGAEGEIVEEKKELGKEEIVAEELDDCLLYTSRCV